MKHRLLGGEGSRALLCRGHGFQARGAHPWSSREVTASSMAKMVILTSCAPLPQMYLLIRQPPCPPEAHVLALTASMIIAEVAHMMAVFGDHVMSRWW